MLEYWYFFLIIFVVMLIGLMFISGMRHGLRDIRYRYRFMYNVGYILLLFGIIGLLLIVVVEGFF